jgi:hypothetical protein
MRLVPLLVASALLIAACSRTHPPTASPGSSTMASHSAGTASATTFPDGIPTSIGGQPVIRPGAALAFASARNDATPFLIGGWTSGPVVIACPTAVAGPSLAPSCIGGNPSLGESAGDNGIWQSLFNLAGVRLPGSGPVVLQVHSHDPRAADCPPDLRPTCEMAIVIDSVAWTP